jgi:transcriptional regulator with XRE-family HTH domain
MTTIARRIKLYRLGKGFSQQEMADRLNISQSAYAKIENGFTRIDVDRLRVICTILELDPDELLRITPKDGESGFEHDAFVERNDQRMHEAYAETIRNLKKEIEFLRKLLMKEKER